MVRSILFLTDRRLDEPTADKVRILGLINGLRAAGCDVKMVAPRTRHVLEIHSWRSSQSKVIRTIATWLLSPLALEKAIRNHKPDFIYCYFSSWLFLSYALIALRRLPYSVELNGVPSQELPYLYGSIGRMLVPVSNFVEKWAYGHAKWIGVVSDSLERYIRQQYKIDARHIHLIPNGVDTALFRPMDKVILRQKLGLDLGGRYALIVSSMQPWHGILECIEATALLSSEFPDLYLVLLGDGREMPAARKRAEDLKISQRIIFKGIRPHTEIPMWINASDVALSPITRCPTGFPVKIFEYLACAKSVVTNMDVPLPEELQARWIYRIKGQVTAQAIGNELGKALKSPLYDHSDEEKLYGYVQENFSWDAIARSILAWL